MIIADMDGVILEPWEPGAYDPVPTTHRIRAAAILTNQGGLALRWAGLSWAQKYPGLRQTLVRVRAAMRCSGARIALVAAHHPKQCQTLRGRILAAVGRILPPLPLGGGVWLSLRQDHRKPRGDGLLWLCRRLRVNPSRVVFLGDEKSDEEAARNAGVQFRLIPSRRT